MHHSYLDLNDDNIAEFECRQHKTAEFGLGMHERQNRLQHSNVDRQHRTAEFGLEIFMRSARESGVEVFSDS